MNSKDHPFISFCHDLASICRPLNHIGIDYLSYTRVYNDGGRICLSSRPKILEEHFAQKKYLRCGNEKHPDSYKSDEIILWSTLANQSVYEEARLMDIHHGIYLFGKKNDGYCDSLGFASADNDPAIINNYFNNFDLLKKFVSYFHEEASTLLSRAEQYRVVLPFNDESANPAYKSHQVEKLFSVNNSLGKLTNRQRECIYLLIQGKPTKIIASELNISIRTLEDHLRDIKIRLHCKNKTELIIKLAKALNIN